MDNAEKIMSGDRLTLSRMLTHVENDDPRGRQMLDELFRYTGKAHLVGITGSPGTGKSSLANKLTKLIRSPGDYKVHKTVAIVAVDPTSPFTGGAILGDRVRMKDLHGDEGVFIRSMASRGALGGIARTTAAVVQVLDAAGFDFVLIETVGAGQAEVEIARLAHTTIVVEAPGLGDDIQAIKAGIMEIADILVVNKADLPGVENAERALRMNLELAHGGRAEPGWDTPVLKTVSLSGEGISAVLKAIDKHAEYLHVSGEWERRDQERLRSELETLVGLRLMDTWRAGITKSEYDKLLRQIEKRKLSPYQAAEELTKK